MCERECRLNGRKLSEQDFGTLFLCIRPFVGGHHQKPLTTCKQFCPCLLILQTFGVELRIAPYGIAILINPRTVILCQLFHPQPMFLPVIGILCHLLPAVFPAHFLQRLQAELLMMESVKCAHGVGKAFLHYAVHTVREVQRDLYDTHSQHLRYFLQCLDYFLCLCTSNNGNDAAFASMRLLVAYYCIDLACGKARLVNTDMLAYVFRKNKPLVGMFQFRPFPKTAEMVLVRLFVIVPINKIVFFKRTGRYRERLQTLVLKKPPTP